MTTSTATRPPLRPVRRTSRARRVWHNAVTAAPVLGVCVAVARPWLSEGRVHSHRPVKGRAGEALAASDVLEAARCGAGLEEQRAICGCDKAGWVPPPSRAGRARSRTP